MHTDGNAGLEPLTIPTPPQSPPSPAFPLVACIAPLIASGAVWAITQSPLSLVFAVLSPLIALGSLADARWQTRKRRRQSNSVWQQAAERLRADIASQHQRERSARIMRAPSASVILANSAPMGSRWDAAGGAVQLCVGHGTAPSSVRLQGGGQSEEQRALKALAASVVDAVIDVDARRGVGLVGERRLVMGAMRSLAIQLAHRIPPREAAYDSPAGREWQWIHALPHRTDSAVSSFERVLTVQLVDAWPQQGAERRPGRTDERSGVMLAIAPVARLLPPGCATVISVRDSHSARVLAADDGTLIDLVVRPELVSEARASGFAHSLARDAADAGLDPRTRPIGQSIPLTGLALDQRDPKRPLRAALAVTDRGPLVLDLDAEGPHAIVAGTTGSGKSELLITWVASIARGNTPDDVIFLLVDFKGGATFEPLTVLPHCVGVITDLDEPGAARALASLRAELRYRERRLSECGAKSVKDLPSGARLPRLVIVVDEFAALAASFGELQSVFVDIAARGRSLGVHLILATQRPVGVMRESLLANCGLRLSLRVNNAADSVALVGSGEASELPADQPGLVVVSSGGRNTTALVAQTPEHIIRELVEGCTEKRWAAPRRPWLDPLPVSIPFTSAMADSRRGSGSAIVLGLSDEPDEQRQPRVDFDPITDGNLLALGAHRSGKSRLLATIAAQRSPHASMMLISRETDDAWDELMEAFDRCTASEERDDQSPRPPLILLIDDLDSLLARLGDDHRAALGDVVATILRDGPRAGIFIVATAARLICGLQPSVGLFDSQLLFRMSSRNDHVLAGGDPQLYDPGLPAGRAIYRGRLLQVAQPPQEPPAGLQPRHRESEQPRFEFERGKTYALVSRSPARRLAWLRRQRFARITVTSISDRESKEQWIAVGPNDPASVYVGDPDAWQAEWALLTRLRGASTLLFDGCTLGDVRALTRRSTLPPPLRGAGNVWVCDEEGTIGRARLFASQR